MKFYLNILVIICFQSGFSQQTKLDSLLNSYQMNPSVHLLNKLAEAYADSAPRKSVRYSLKSFEQQRKTNSSFEEVYYNLGVAYRKLDLYDSSIQFFNKALTIFNSKKNFKKAILSEIWISKNYSRQGFYSKAFDHVSTAIKESIKTSDSLCLVKAMDMLGILYRDQNEYDKADTTFKEALHIARRLKDDNTITSILYGLGVTYVRKQKYDEAIACCEEAYSIAIITNDLRTASYCLSNLGVVFHQKKLYDKALNYHLQALAIREKINDKFGTVQCYINIGNVYLRKKEYQKNIDYHLKAMALSKEINSFSNLKDIYNNLSFGYAKEHLNNPVKELAYYMLFTELKDSLYNVEIEQKLTETEVTFEYEKKIALEKVEQNKRDELSLQKLDQQKNISLIFIIGFLILGTLSFIIYRNYQFKKKAAAILSLQKQEIEDQKEIIEHKSKLITQSINYSKRIQDAFIQSEIVLKESEKEYFLINQPKDIVSGDFLWAKKTKTHLLFAVADCTGHGVPGAFMSLVGYNLLEQATEVHKRSEPKDILDTVNVLLQKALKPSAGNSSYEGMDILICSLDLKSHHLLFAGTKQRLYHCSSETIAEHRTESISIGLDTDKKFNNFELQLQKNDVLYLFTDGYPDQKGGPDKLKLYYDAFKTLLNITNSDSLESKKLALADYLQNWKGTEEQVDDVLVFGIRI